jgi:hypothetical protein
MSRGIGKIQNGLFCLIRDHGKPMTVKEMQAAVIESIDLDPSKHSLKASKLRSFRRALNGQVKDGLLIAIGNGRNGSPFRYGINPVTFLLTDNKAEFEKWFEQLPTCEQARITKGFVENLEKLNVHSEQLEAADRPDQALTSN